MEVCCRILQRHINLQSLLRKSKCAFRVNRLQFLSHIIIAKGTSLDPEKIAAIEAWPMPQSVKEVRSFLGLLGFYRRFISKYAQLIAPLTELLKKGETFSWGEGEDAAFQALRKALISASVMAYPYFEKPFQIDIDACEIGVGAVLSQEGHPIAHYSKKMSRVRQKASTYAHELWAVTDSVRKWSHYLLGHPFEIRTHHRSLKNLLSQSIQMPEQ